MDMPLLMLLLVATGLGAGVYGLLRKLASPRERLPLTVGWIDELSPERYRPMMRLLDGEDLQFLRSQPGFSRSMVHRLRARRCDIFRGYLRCLNQDFARICLALKLVLIQSRSDRPDLAAALVRQQVLFAAGMAAVQMRLFFYQYGLGGVNASSLVRSFDSMRIELQSLVPATLAMNA